MNRCTSHHLEFIVAESKNGSNNYTFSGMDTHRIHILHTTDNDASIGSISHHLEFNLLPAKDTFFNQYLVDPRAGETEFDDPDQLLFCFPNPPSGSSQGICRAHNRREPDCFYRFVDLA